jgi:hypothetical protein
MADVLGVKGKAIELNVVDNQTEKIVKSTYDAGVIISVQEYRRGGVDRTICSLGPGVSFLVEETYLSVRKRWLEARDQEMVPIEPEKKLSVV